MNLKFEKAKINRELQRSGKEYNFKRAKKNKFGEESDELEDVCTIKCIYHENNGYVAITTGENVSYRSKKTPMLLTLYENATILNSGDFVEIGENKFVVTGIVNVQEWGIIADICLEVFDNGR